jgi:hypothetical protein
VAIGGYVVHTAALVTYELMGAQDWPRVLELIYLVSLLIWVPAFTLALWGRAQARREVPGVIGGEARTNLLFARAHAVALVVVLVLQLPFIFFGLDIPAKALAQITVTTCVMALFGAYAWLNR